MTRFEPEMGQALFSNAGHEECELPAYVERGLDEIAEEINVLRYGTEAEEHMTLTMNSGEPEFVCPEFEMRSYCWCDGDHPGHEVTCPPNFAHPASGLIVRWYKHSGRGASINRVPSRGEWRKVRDMCLAALDADGRNG